MYALAQSSDPRQGSSTFKKSTVPPSTTSSNANRNVVAQELGREAATFSGNDKRGAYDPQYTVNNSQALGAVPVSGLSSPSKTKKNEGDNKNKIDSSFSRQTHRAQRAAANKDESYDDNVSIASEESNSNIPGATNVQGVRRTAPTTTAPLYNPTPTPQYTSPPDTNSEYIQAHLVEEGTVNPIEREEIRREAQEELIKASAQAEIADPVDNRKWYICACVSTLIIIGVVVGAVVATREDPPAPLIVNNSFCNEAKPIKIEGSVRESTASSDIVDVDTCVFEDFNSMTKGRWFTFSGNGAIVTASTCLNTKFDTRISIFAGGLCSEDELKCIDGNEDSPASCCAPGIDDCEERSAVTWSTQNGLQYYIYVHGANPDETGDFQLSLSEANTAPGGEVGQGDGSNTAEAPVNAICEGAIRVAVDSDAVTGSNEGALMPDLATCGPVTSNGPGAWYVTRGAGGSMAATTCESSGTLDDTQISVYSGACDTLECIRTNDDSCGTKSDVSWPSVEGTDYYIFVHSKTADMRGTFDLRVDSIQESDLSAQCLDETVLLNDAELQAELQSITEASAAMIVEEDCQFLDDGTFSCVVDGLRSAEDKDIIKKMCEARGGRYILFEGGYNCDIIEIITTDSPACYSWICTEEMMISQTTTGLEVLAPVIESQFAEFNLDCEPTEVSVLNI